MWNDWQREYDNRESQFEQVIIKKTVGDLKKSLKDDESYFLEEAKKHFILDGQNSASKIKQAIYTVITTEENKYLHKSKEYMAYKNIKITAELAVKKYVELLKENFTEGLSDDDVDFIVTSYLGFLQRKSFLLEQGKIDKEQTDIKNFLKIYKKVTKNEDNADKIKHFLEKLYFSKTNLYQNELEWRIVENFNKKASFFLKEEDLSEKDRKDTNYIKGKLIEIVWISQYEEFLSDFFDQTKWKTDQNIEDRENIIKKLIKKYTIDEEDSIIYDLYDYLERLRKIVF